MSFLDFAAQHGLQIRRFQADGRIHRCPTVEKPRSDNGAYMVDGERGWLMDWAKGDSVIWWHDPSAKPWTPEQKAEAERKRRETAKERARLALKAAQEASRLLGDAEWLRPSPGRAMGKLKTIVGKVEGHPYLIKKGFPLEPGFVLAWELLIPMFDCQRFGQPIGLQRVDADGSKKFLPGQRAKGAVYRFGTGKSRTVWLCEGYATALTVRDALRAMYQQADVVACFSAGNLTHVASLGLGTHVMADNDSSQAGEKAAVETGLPWVMPVDVGMDANDLMCRDGIDAVCELLRR